MVYAVWKHPRWTPPDNALPARERTKQQKHHCLWELSDARWGESTGLFSISWPCMLLSNVEIYLCTGMWSSGCDSSWKLDNFLPCIHTGLSSACAGTVNRWRFLRPSQKSTNMTCVCVLMFLNEKEFPPGEGRDWNFVKLRSTTGSSRQTSHFGTRDKHL